jgi:aminopeptidase C
MRKWDAMKGKHEKEKSHKKKHENKINNQKKEITLQKTSGLCWKFFLNLKVIFYLSFEW